LNECICYFLNPLAVTKHLRKTKEVSVHGYSTPLLWVCPIAEAEHHGMEGWQSEAAHLIAGRKQREERGRDS
jgi:hypothetical protein